MKKLTYERIKESKTAAEIETGFYWARFDNDFNNPVPVKVIFVNQGLKRVPKMLMIGKATPRDLVGVTLREKIECRE
jgi:hypothetical protein